MPAEVVDRPSYRRGVTPAPPERVHRGPLRPDSRRAAKDDTRT
jgi:hypothetical protein